MGYKKKQGGLLQASKLPALRSGFNPIETPSQTQYKPQIRTYIYGTLSFTALQLS